MTHKKLFKVIIIIFIISNSCANETDTSNFPRALTRQLSSEHFEYYISDSDYVDTELQEKYFNWLIEQLQVDFKNKIKYYKFRNRKHIYSYTGVVGNAFAEPDSNALFTIFSWDNHECVHLVFSNYERDRLSQYTGILPAFFSEGVAVAHQVYLKNGSFTTRAYWNEKEVHEIAKDYYANGKLPKLNDLLESPTFWKMEDNISYPVAGSFTRYLIDEYGIDKFLSFTELSRHCDRHERIMNNFYGIYEEALDSIWLDWISYIQEY